MTFSDDSSSSPAAPFSGDGSIFEQPDVILESPTTTERVVDTQSGFMVVVKRLGVRLGLSFRRRVGTPPTSTVILTPDESVKLSRILATTLAGVQEPDLDLPDLDAPRRSRLSSYMARSGENISARIGKSGAQAWPVLGVIATAVLIVGLIGGYLIGRQHVSAKPVPLAQTDPLEPEKIDRFARRYVADMLDFNPSTYHHSQVRAMSTMSPDLLQKYWKETNFPLNDEQLQSAPQGTTVIITRIGKERVGQSTAIGDIYAELVKPNTKISSPIHLKLTLGVDEEGAIRVNEQQDLTSAAPEPTSPQ